MSPFTLMRRLSEEMDRVFGDFGFGGLGLFPGMTSARRGRGRTQLGSQFGNQLAGGLPDLTQAVWVPSVDVVQRGDDLVVTAELPGVPEEDIAIEITDGLLAISGQRAIDRESDRSGVYRSERIYGSFYRAIPLPDGADIDNARAEFRNGVLEITIPNPQSRQQDRTRRLEIGRGSQSGRPSA